MTQEEKTEQTEPVAKEETVIGENAEIVYQYYYTEDQRTAEQVEPVQNYLLGLNLAQVRSIYDGWQVVFFSPDKVILRSDESFLLGEQNGMLAVFREDADGKITLYECTDVPLSVLPEIERQQIREGVRILGEDNLARALADYIS